MRASDTLESFATKIPGRLKKKLDEVCGSMGLKKGYVVESALREKLEDLIDAHDLNKAIKEAAGFHDWASVKKQRLLKNKSKS